MSSAPNPFDSDVEERQLGAASAATQSKKKSSSKPSPSSTASKSHSSKSKPKKSTVPPPPAQSLVQDLFGDISESDSEAESCGIPAPAPALVPAKKRKLKHPLEDEFHEQEPVRASALRSFLSRRTGSGVSFQRDYTRQGEYYIELRVYNAREAERLGTDRWKTALVSYKSAVDMNAPTWKATTELVKAAKREFQGIQPILYPNQII